MDPRARRAMLCAPLTPVPPIRSPTPAEHGGPSARGDRSTRHHLPLRHTPRCRQRGGAGGRCLRILPIEPAVHRPVRAEARQGPRHYRPGEGLAGLANGDDFWDCNWHNRGEAGQPAHFIQEVLDAVVRPGQADGQGVSEAKDPVAAPGRSARPDRHVGTNSLTRSVTQLGFATGARMERTR
jgi:hypothetical protein